MVRIYRHHIVQSHTTRLMHATDKNSLHKWPQWTREKNSRGKRTPDINGGRIREVRTQLRNEKPDLIWHVN